MYCPWTKLTADQRVENGHEGSISLTPTTTLDV